MTNWLIEHPDAGYDKCAEALEDIGTTPNSIGINAARVKRVTRWRSANPDGTPGRLLPGTGHDSPQGRQPLTVGNPVAGERLSISDPFKV